MAHDPKTQTSVPLGCLHLIVECNREIALMYSDARNISKYLDSIHVEGTAGSSTQCMGLGGSRGHANKLARESPDKETPFKESLTS